MPPPSGENSGLNSGILLARATDLVASLYGQSRAQEWQLSRLQFVAGLERSVQKRFAGGPCSPGLLEEYLNTLYVEDLALACACIDGSEAAWEFFVAQYRGYLRASAGAVTKGSRAGTDARELADSLFAELFGLADGRRGEYSLFRYFHGRSSLKTWLRTILAQRHIDKIRESRRWESLDEKGADEESKETPRERENTVQPILDPHRDRYVGLFVKALDGCLQKLEHQDRLRLELYYAKQMTLAEIGRKLGEHESSASRNLERVRRELRQAVEAQLRGAMLLSEAEIALCLQYAAEDVPIDFRKMFPEKEKRKAGDDRKGTP
jgi:RNA polymerase sigma-70 factor, ECF subfamily